MPLRSEPAMKPMRRLTKIMTALRDPETGCDWDLKQNHHSLIPYLIEESYEVIDAIEAGDDAHFCEELGDLLLQIVFHAQLAAEEQRFTLDDIATAISDKLVRRHPHVFGDVEYASDAERAAAWENHKQQEREISQIQASVLDGVPNSLPALMRSQKLQRRAARVGFDWDHAHQVIPKIHEEISEIEAAVKQGESSARVEEEVGDLLFAVVNYARKLNIDAENALRLGNKKFSQRFHGIEKLLSMQNQKIEDTDQQQLEALWDRVKKTEKAK